jgi:DNA-binding SARP family transcriptional activator
VEFGVLGPLEVREGDRVVRLAGAKQGALLAILLLNANRVVSSDQLLDELWGDEPPESGATALQVRVSQLRKALGDGGARLRTQAPGYLIEVGPTELDLFRFERLVQDADGADPPLAAASLRNALAIWRGPALVDFAYEPFAQLAIGRLEELRVLALERRVASDLELGRHAELVGELETLVSEHPLRELLHWQLMLALYRSGRQAEALGVFQETRRVLVEELGIEPGPALQDLERSILRQDRALDVPGAPPSRRSILVAPWRDDALGSLLAVAASLATRPSRELILARVAETADGLAEAASSLAAPRESLLADGVVARVAAFVSRSPGADVARIAAEQDVDLVLVGGAPALLDDAELAELLARAPCDVGILVGPAAKPGSVLVPFAGAEHDWSAVEVGAWLAGSWDAPLRLAGPSERDGRDASRLLASASLAVQRALGVSAEPLLLEPGADGLVGAAAGAAITVVGLTDRWRKDGVGPVRSALAGSGFPTLLVRRGLRPGGLAPQQGLTRFTWSLAPQRA